jgi:hypothetical protein
VDLVSDYSLEVNLVQFTLVNFATARGDARVVSLTLYATCESD